MDLKNTPIGPQSDLQPISFSAVVWDANDPVRSLDDVARAITDEAEEVIRWYLDKKRAKKRGAIWLRVVAIALTAMAAVVPVLVEIFEPEIVAGTGGLRPWWASAAWSSVFLVGAAALVLLDRFYGFSSAWMRFLSAEFEIREALHAFQMEWQMARAGWNRPAPTEQQIQDGLQACRAFLARLDAILRNELEAWMQEFRASLKDIDEAAKARPDAPRGAAANITIENGEQCTDGWKLSIDNGPPRHSSGRTVALNNLLPGMRLVEVTGDIAGKPVRAARTFAAAPGSAVEVSIKLE